WYFIKKGQAPVVNIPTIDVSKLSTDLTGNFKSLTDSLASVQDAASANAALPKISDLSAKLDSMKEEMEKLPAAEKAKFIESIKPSLGKLEDQFAKLMWIPGVSDKVQPAVDKVMGQLASLGGSQLPQLSGDLAGAFSSLTDTLSGIKDEASAAAALPKINDLSGKLDRAKETMDKLPADGKSTISSIVQAAL